MFPPVLALSVRSVYLTNCPCLLAQSQLSYSNEGHRLQPGAIFHTLKNEAGRAPAGLTRPNPRKTKLELTDKP